VSQTRRSTLDTARPWFGFVKLCHRPRSPNSTTPKCPWAEPRFHNRIRTIQWPTVVSRRSTGCIPMRAQVFERLCPLNSCSTTRTVLQDQWDQSVQLRRLRQWSQWRQLVRLPPLRQDHPVPPSVQADLPVPPPHWNSSKWFYSLNILNTKMKPMPFGVM
jgi:hypothetical protein